MKQKKEITADEINKIFDEGKEDIIQHFDKSKAQIHVPIQRINIDIPGAILMKLDKEADRIGVTRTSFIKLWIAERVDRLAG